MIERSFEDESREVMKRYGREVCATFMQRWMQAVLDNKPAPTPDDVATWMPSQPTGSASGTAVKEVPRGHCNRCDRCGWEMRDDRGACRPGDCSMRPMPAERSTCAGCGAPFTAPAQEKRRG